MRIRTFMTLLLVAACMGMSAQKRSGAPAPCGPLPTKSQVAWQQMETYAFVHFGLNTFSGDEWGFGNVDPMTFNPTQLDCEQWVRTFIEAGMKGVIITAKHHDGFCLWPSKYTDYSIKRSPYKQGKGDIVGELAAACRKYGLKFGVYLSPWDRHQASYATPAYITYYRNQLQELLDRYSPMFEVWFDGANGGDGYYGGACEKRSIPGNYYGFQTLYDMVYKANPEAIIFSGPGCRWIGNEDGVAEPTNWSMGTEDGNHWAAGECDVSIRKGWFYHPEEDSLVKTPQKLLDLYYRSVGHNATLLLNFPVDRTGRVNAIDSAYAVGFRKLKDNNFSNNLLSDARIKASSVRASAYAAKHVTDGSYDSYWATPDGTTTGWLEFTLRRPTSINRLMLQEYIPLGQRVKAFTVEYWQNGAWKPVDAGEVTTTIGYKRLLRFPAVKTQKVRVRFTDARACLCINGVGAYYVE